MLLWLVSEGIVLPPSKWSAVHVDGKGLPEHYLDGSALVRETAASQHTTSRVAKGLMDPRIQQDAKLALVACQGIISLHNDSIRKYVKDECKHGHKQAKTKRAAAKRTKTSAAAEGTPKSKNRGKRPGGGRASRKRPAKRKDDSDEQSHGEGSDAEETTGGSGRQHDARAQNRSH